VLGAFGAPSVRVPALPGFVADRLAFCMANEAMAVVEEGTARADDVDVALRLAMNHPLGPFEHVGRLGARVVHEGLRSMVEVTGDPRYRPAQLLRRRAAGAS
jgi:3-hydroxybutyryl-CoA dehydrogenase